MRRSPNLFMTEGLKSPRNSFDLSRDDHFSHIAGDLMPVYCVNVEPNDYFEINVSNFTRTFTLNTAAFARLHECCDFFFVPYRLIWAWWNDFITHNSTTGSGYNPNIIGDTVNPPIGCPYILGSTIYNYLNATTSDLFGYQRRVKLYRLLDMLGYPVANSLGATITMYSSTGPLTAVRFNPFRLYAYMRIYQEYYRNSQYEVNKPGAYNLDAVGDSGEITVGRFGAWMDELNLTYVNFEKDMFTSVLPTAYWNAEQQFSPSIPMGIMNSINMSGSGVSVYGTPTAGQATELSAQAIRTVLAVEKMAMVSALAPKTFRGQMQALFGVTPDSCASCDVQRIGSLKGNIQIGEVTSTAAGMNDTGRKSDLGQIAGKGVGSGNGHIKFHSKEAGILMGIHYIKPDLCYNSDRVDPFNRKFFRSDFHQRALDSLGMQPILASARQGISKTGYTAANLNIALGYGSRYAEYKSDVSRVHGCMQAGGSLSQWVAPYSTPILNLMTPSGYKVTPAVLDGIFANAYSGTGTDTDQFICHYRFDVSAVRDMSIYGIPV